MEIYFGWGVVELFHGWLYVRGVDGGTFRWVEEGGYFL